jgi:hypothetical protein
MRTKASAKMEKAQQRQTKAKIMKAQQKFEHSGIIQTGYIRQARALLYDELEKFSEKKYWDLTSSGKIPPQTSAFAVLAIMTAIRLSSASSSRVSDILELTKDQGDIWLYGGGNMRIKGRKGTTQRTDSFLPNLYEDELVQLAVARYKTWRSLVIKDGCPVEIIADDDLAYLHHLHLPPSPPSRPPF